MDQFEIYANVERSPHNLGKSKSLEKNSESIHANEDRIHKFLEPNKAGSTLSGAGDGKKSLCRAAAMFLGLLCLLLLAGLTTAVYLYMTEWKIGMVLLQTRLNLTKERDQLQSSYNNLTKEKEQLQSSYNHLTKEREQLQASNKVLAEAQQQLNHEKIELQRKLQDQLQWIYFSGRFYYLSTQQKSWQESRADCLQRGADLVIINSKEEQDFTRRFRNGVWIGLTDRETEGTWKWVDGTPLSTSYWTTKEPNGQRNENCVEIMNHDVENSWNDVPCGLGRFWICEKTP